MVSLTAVQVLTAGSVAAGAYGGTFRGTTAQGTSISFVVDAGDRVVTLNLVYVLPGCEVKQNVNTSVPIKGGSFTFSLKLPNNAVSVSGRFTSASSASGTLKASSDCGSASTTWKATKGGRAAPAPASNPKTKPKEKQSKPDPASARYEGLWEGNVALPGGLPEELLDLLDPPNVLIYIFDGVVEAVDFPLLVKGPGCATGDSAAKEFSPPRKLTGKGFSIAFTVRGVKVVLAGRFDSATRAHGTVTAQGGLEGCEGGSKLSWRAANSG